MLDKYDEEEEDAGMEIDASGAVNDEKARKQAEIRAKLAAGGFPACICCVRLLNVSCSWNLHAAAAPGDGGQCAR